MDSAHNLELQISFADLWKGIVSIDIVDKSKYLGVPLEDGPYPRQPVYTSPALEYGPTPYQVPPDGLVYPTYAEYGYPQYIPAYVQSYNAPPYPNPDYPGPYYPPPDYPPPGYPVGPPPRQSYSNESAEPQQRLKPKNQQSNVDRRKSKSDTSRKYDSRENEIASRESKDKEEVP
ncbi:unnamed protein product [Strongylus vulgaris]|uniref:Uncharacterized protein n=1 Tax=Strongylus vulgaris TaxID=40348 RepID=A0A3P7IHW0_STRVU|nr:unnamed protein product [Strongylus vulgaris]